MEAKVTVNEKRILAMKLVGGEKTKFHRNE